MSEPLDTGDVDALDALIDSAGWKLVKARIEMQLERARRALEVPGTPEELTARCRGEIGMIRMVLNLPKSMRDEMAPKRN